MPENNDHSKMSGPDSQMNQRIVSLDALRGFDMFWIVGAEGIIHALKQISDAGAVRFLVGQMDHKAWAGFAFYDLIFPLFVFIVGVSLVFSLGKTIDQESRASVVRRLFKRALILYVFGIICYGGLSTPYDQIRLLGVLQRIALCYFFAGLAFCFLKTRGQLILCISLLVGYWIMMTWVSVPGIGAGNFEEGKNLANYIDQKYLPWRKWDGDHDPEGLLSTLPAIATCLLGVFAGNLVLRNNALSGQRKVYTLIFAGLGLVILGWIWNLQFPVIKKIWTSSYVLVAGGYSCILLAAFYQVVDVWKFQRWAQPFIWIGMNPITIYMAHNLINFDKLALLLVGGDVKRLLGRFDALAVAVVVVGITFAFCHFLYKRKIFLRV